MINDLRSGMLSLLVAISIVGSAQMYGQDNSAVSVIPKPLSLVRTDEAFTLRPSMNIFVDSSETEVRATADYLRDVIRRASGHSLAVKPLGPGQSPGEGILFRLSPPDSSLGDEGYELVVTRTQVVVRAARPAGLFYAVQSMLQLMPPAVYTATGITLPEVTLPGVRITDRPRFRYRGMHLDVSRHFFPKEFVKRYIDLLALHKLNRFHWHLTDDNGWRIEIKRYPKLTEIAAWSVDRSGVTWRLRSAPQPGEAATYGGFYTQDEIREVVAYARQRHVTVLPEIEMPGHSSEVFAAYPELSCTGETLFVRPGHYWPNVDILCAGNDSTFAFLEGVLAEVAALFPYEYIHIGGDEADKTRWRACPKCQARIREEGLKDEAELQSYFIKRIEKYVRSMGKRIIGWDEILEGGLAPQATVMSWRGVDGGIEAARQGHEVIMTPTTHCYFDYYQADPAFEPEAIGGYVTLAKVYSYEPIPEELTPDQAKFVLGVQGNVWSEFIPTGSHAEYMSVPRMSALSEVAWSPKEAKSWPDFRSRLTSHFARLDAMGINYSKGSFRVTPRTIVDEQTGKPFLVLETEQDNPDIRYTLDGSEPTARSPRYAGPLPLDAAATVSAVILSGERPAGPAVSEAVTLHAGFGARVQYASAPSARYPAAENALVDGLRGSFGHADGRWLGFRRESLGATITLQGRRSVRSVDVTFLVNPAAYIHDPVEVSAEMSLDGTSYTVIGKPERSVLASEGTASIVRYRFDIPGSARVGVLRVSARSVGVIPPGNRGEGDEAWLFVDEVSIQ